MLSRALGIIVCICIIALGVAFIGASSTSNMAPTISGTAMIFMGFVVLTVIVISTFEHVADVLIHQDESIADIDPFQDDLDTPVPSKENRASIPWMTPELWGMIDACNTPDPHLIHPDDLKRQSIYQADYAELEACISASINHLNIKV
jgi:hypothetical protein